MDTQHHWENVYHTKASTNVSWYAPHLETSRGLIRRIAPDLNAAILDVGSGASTLTDDLLEAGYCHLGVLDISSHALAITQARLGEQAQQVQWLVGNVLEVDLPAAYYDVWHDRAVFHFLTEQEQRECYVQQVCKAVKPGGHVVMATFGTEGPKQCSGLEVMRYDATSLHGEFGKSFRLLDSLKVDHLTPTGKKQQFLYYYCRLHD